MIQHAKEDPLSNKAKIEAIQKAIREGTFKADAERIAENMLAIDQQLIKQKQTLPEKERV